MSKFIIECPVCHRYAEAKTGFLARKKIDCTCGYTIDVKTNRMTTRVCSSCGNTVMYDQAQGKNAKCPVCHAQLVTDESLNSLVHFHCNTCGCNLQADKAAKVIVCPVCDTEQDVQVQVKLEQEHNTGMPSVIRYEGDNTTFVWRHPNTDFVTGSQLIVHESQEAIFFRNGEALDSFGAGRYTLETGILPKMDQLYRLPVQSQPFHAEVYFVNLTTQMGIKWGTPSKVGLFDPITGLHVELGASGSFNLRVSDPRKLLIKLVGTTGGLSQSDLFQSSTASASFQATGIKASATANVNAGYFRTMIATKVKGNLARIIKSNRFNVLELDEHVDSISLALRDAINPELAEYGLIMPEFYVANIVTPDDDPNFRRLKQQHADMYLRSHEEEIKKAEAEAAFERKVVEAQTEARMRVIGAQGEVDATRISGQAQADVYRMQAEAEAQEMRIKGYTYQQETARQVSLEAMRNGGGTGVTGIAGEAMQLGVGLGAVGSVIGMTKEAIQPVMQNAGSIAQPITPSAAPEGWTCACGKTGITSKFCPECGSKKPELSKAWNCSCGQTGIISKFCPNCGNKRPETWDCVCGMKGIASKFCPECGKKRED